MRGTQTTQVDVADLLDVIRANRAEHRDLFLKAQEKYRERVIEELDKRLEEVRRGKPISLGFHLPEPVDYTDSYDEAIEMLEWETREVVELDQQTFRQLVMNKWEWAQMFAANTTAYLAE